jgi:cytochrome c
MNRRHSIGAGHMNAMKFSLVLLFGIGIGSVAAAAPNVERGQMLARTNCASCHSIDKVTPSPLGIAPPFRTLHERYPVEALQKSLAEGIRTGHPTMPEFRFDPDQIGDFIAYLKTLE